MTLDPIIKALRVRCPTFGTRVAGAAQWAGLTEDESPPLPAAYVVPLREDAGSMDDAVGYYQVVTNTFGVILSSRTSQTSEGRTRHDGSSFSSQRSSRPFSPGR